MASGHRKTLYRAPPPPYSPPDITLTGGGITSPNAKGGGRLEPAWWARSDLDGMTLPLPSHPSLDMLLTQLEALDARITSEADIAQAKLGELRRQAKARPYRRGGAGSVDTRKYAIGGAVVMLAGEVDAIALLGLFAQTDMMLRWMAESRLARGPQPFGTLLRAILDDPRKADWCRRWGGILEWANRRALYDASVRSFEASGRTGPNEPWRRHPVSNDQGELVDTLCRILSKPLPALVDKGAAYEWIKEHGGNPAHWVPPPHPNNWSDDDDG